MMISLALMQALGGCAAEAVTGVRTEPSTLAAASAAKAKPTARPLPGRPAGPWPETDVSARKTFSFAHKG
jgi:hypothetical protein